MSNYQKLIMNQNPDEHEMLLHNLNIETGPETLIQSGEDQDNSL